MICEVRNNGQEVVLSHVTFGDVIAFIKVWLSKNKEVSLNLVPYVDRCQKCSGKKFVIMWTAYGLKRQEKNTGYSPFVGFRAKWETTMQISMA